MTKEEFINECAFAKVVETQDGCALLIGGKVINVDGPRPCGCDDSFYFYAEWLVEALRLGTQERMRATSNLYNAGAVKQ